MGKIRRAAIEGPLWSSMSRAISGMHVPQHEPAPVHCMISATEDAPSLRSFFTSRSVTALQTQTYIDFGC